MAHVHVLVHNGIYGFNLQVPGIHVNSNLT